MSLSQWLYNIVDVNLCILIFVGDHLLEDRDTMVDVTPTVREFYAGKNIFLTGVTGFVGKALLEKLLRCCPEVGNIYCLVRAKKNQKGTERLRNIFNDKVCYAVMSSLCDCLKW